MKNYTSNSELLTLVKSTPKSDIAIHKGDTFTCISCGSKYYFSNEIKGKNITQLKNNLHRIHALDCPTYNNPNHNAGIRSAIRTAVTKFNKNNERIYSGSRYRIAVVNNSVFTVIDKSTGDVYNSFYENRKLVILKVV